eukprot:3935591-Rhodomonas_salina.1
MSPYSANRSAFFETISCISGWLTSTTPCSSRTLVSVSGGASPSTSHMSMSAKHVDLPFLCSDSVSSDASTSSMLASGDLFSMVALGPLAAPEKPSVTDSRFPPELEPADSEDSRWACESRLLALTAIQFRSYASMNASKLAILRFLAASVGTLNHHSVQNASNGTPRVNPRLETIAQE